MSGVGHLGHGAAMEAGGREFDTRPRHYSRMSFQSNQATGTVSHLNVPSFKILNLFGILFHAEAVITGHLRLSSMR